VYLTGSACVGWDASHWAPDASLACDPNNDQCELWLTPPGWIFDYRCIAQFDKDGGSLLDDAGNPTFACTAQNPTRFAPACLNGGPKNPVDYDAEAEMCSGYFDEFVTHGRAIAGCTFGGLTGFVCGPGVVNAPDNPCGYENVIERSDDSGISCVGPCAP
jgi:hypothetical protein